jgi:hypothetical protein
MLWLALPLCLAVAGCGNSISPADSNGSQTATTTVISASVTSLPTTGTTTLTAVVTNAVGAGAIAPTGTVTFLANGGTTLGNGTPVANTDPNAYSTTYTLVLSGAVFPAATNIISATYSPGDSFHMGSTSTNSITISVSGTAGGGIVTTTALNATPGSQSTLLTATITAASGSVLPIGTVAFVDVTNPKVPITIGQANLTGTGSTASITATTTNLGTGSHSVEAQYLGGTNGSTTFAASTSSVITVTVGGATGTTVTTTALQAAPTTITSSQSTVLTATIASAGATTYPTGTVTFYDQTSSTALGNGTLSNGVTAGTAVATFTAAGSLFETSQAGQGNLIVAQYSGDATFAASTSASVTVTVSGTNTGTGSTPSTTVVTAAPASIAPGACTNISVGVSGAAANVNTAPTGNVILTINGLPLGTVTVNYASQGLSYGYTGLCSNPGTALGGSGTYAIVGVYAGDENYTGSSNGTGDTVTVTGDVKANVNISASVPEGTSSTISLGSCGAVQATVSPVAEPNGVAPTGSVLFFINYSTQIGSAVTLSAGGMASEQVCTGAGTAITAKGSYVINADYGGDNDYNAAASDMNATLLVD